jgi:hypothetical protein
MSAMEHPITRRPGVHRLLVTGRTEAQLERFHLEAGLVANAVERRGNTVLYTVFDEELELVIKAARRHYLTVQQRADSDQPPYWLVVNAGIAEPWKPEAE